MQCTCIFKANADITLTFCCNLAVVICHIGTVVQTVLIKVVGKPFVSRRLKVFGQIMVALVYCHIVSCLEKSPTNAMMTSLCITIILSRNNVLTRPF